MPSLGREEAVLLPDHHRRRGRTRRGRLLRSGAGRESQRDDQRESHFHGRRVCLRQGFRQPPVDLRPIRRADKVVAESREDDVRVRLPERDQLIEDRDGRRRRNAAILAAEQPQPGTFNASSTGFGSKP